MSGWEESEHPRDPRTGEFADQIGSGGWVSRLSTRLGFGGDAEARMASRLNRGRKLDAGDPAEVLVIRGIEEYTARREEGTRLPTSDLQEDSPLAALRRVAASAPPVPHALYRGMRNLPPESVPGAGGMFDMDLTSFSESHGTAHAFSTMGRHGHSVLLTVLPGSRALRIDQHSRFSDETEYVGRGRYRVVSKTDARRSPGAQRYYEMVVEQVSP